MNLNFEEIKQGRKVIAIKFSFNRTIVINGVDTKGNPKNTYLKPRRKILLGKLKQDELDLQS